MQQETIDELKQIGILVEGNTENDDESLNNTNVYGQIVSLDRLSRGK